MSKCSICKTNEAVVYANKMFDGENRIEGVCLKCAYEQNFGGMAELFERVGVNEENVDEITSRMNQMMEQFSGQRPEEVLGMLMKGEFHGINDSEWSDIEEDTDLEEDEDDDEVEVEKPRRRGGFSDALLRANSSSGELVPANIGGPEDRGSRRNRKPRRKFLEQFSTNLSEKAARAEKYRIIETDEKLKNDIQNLNIRPNTNTA